MPLKSFPKTAPKKISLAKKTLGKTRKFNVLGRLIGLHTKMYALSGRETAEWVLSKP